jgi:hypothetical protein
MLLDNNASGGSLYNWKDDLQLTLTLFNSTAAIGMFHNPERMAFLVYGCSGSAGVRARVTLCQLLIVAECSLRQKVGACRPREGPWRRRGHVLLVSPVTPLHHAGPVRAAGRAGTGLGYLKAWFRVSCSKKTCGLLVVYCLV